MSREIGTAEIAARNNINRRTALRWLKAIHAQYGSSVVARRGRRFVTTEDAFARVAPLVAKHAATERRLRDLEERVGDQETRLDKQAAELADFRRRAAAWFSRQK